MFGNVTALEGLHVTGKYRGIRMQHTCSRHAAWDPHRLGNGQKLKDEWKSTVNKFGYWGLPSLVDSSVHFGPGAETQA